MFILSVRATFEASKKLFTLPLKEKASYVRDTYTNKGYEVIGGQTLYGQSLSVAQLRHGQLMIACTGQVGGGHEQQVSHLLGQARNA